MSLPTRILGGLRGLFRRQQEDAELDDELRQYLDAAVERKIAAGMSREAATRAARVEMGSAAAIKDCVRDVGWESRLESVWQDIRLAARLLWRDPRFTVAAVVPLALGVGAAVAVYSVAYGILLRPLPLQDESSLVVVYAADEVRSDGAVSHPRLQAWRESGIFQDVAGVRSQRFDIVSAGLAEPVPAAAVTRGFFGLLGVRALHGRVLTDGDGKEGVTAAVISYPLWKRRFAGDPSVVGRTLTAGQYDLTIVGVAPPGFERWRGETHVWVPVEAVTAPFILTSHGYQLFTVVARLRPEVDLRVAYGRLATVDRAFLQQVEPNEVWSGTSGPGVRMLALRDDVVPAVLGRVLVIVLAAVALTWLVVCANLANLLLARGTRRASDLAVRLAIGASRSRIVRQLLVESLVVALPGGALGALLAFWGVPLVVAFGPPGVIGNEAIRVDMPIVAVALGAIVVSSLAFGLWPALRLSRVSLQTVLTERTAPRRVSGVLIAAQIAVAVVVLSGAALLVESFARMTQVDLGFEPRNVLTVQFAFPQKFAGARSPAPEREWRLATQETLVRRLAALPGVADVTLGVPVFRPAADVRSSIGLDDGRRFRNGEAGQRPFAPRPHAIGPGFFRIHGVRMLEGRDFTERDRFDAPRVVIVNETMARMLWPDESPVGRRLNFGAYSPARGYDAPWHEIIGVVADMRYGGVDEPFRPDVYRSALQEPLRGGFAILKTSGRPEELGATALKAIREMDAGIPVYAARTLLELVDESTAMTRYHSALLSLCAGITTVLCSFGLYGMLAYGVAARQRELGIRIALGAGPQRMIAGVLRQAFWPLAAGLTVGLASSWFATQLLSGVLYEVSARDPRALGGAALIVAVLSLLGACIPARRAGRVDPVQALKL